MKYTETPWITILIRGNELFRKKFKNFRERERSYKYNEEIYFLRKGLKISEKERGHINIMRK